jgi:hypothetical protein
MFINAPPEIIMAPDNMASSGSGGYSNWTQYTKDEVSERPRPTSIVRLREGRQQNPMNSFS